MISKTCIRVIIFLSLLFLLSVNFCIAAVQLDEKFLQSSTGNSSVSVQVERFIEDIKNMKLNDGSHPKILGWQRKGNLYTFSFTTPTEIVLKFEHLVSQGGGWSSLSAFEDGQPINAAALIMQISSMPRDKTKFDIADEQVAIKQQKQRDIEQAKLMQNDLKLISSKYGDGNMIGVKKGNREYGIPEVIRTLSVSNLSNNKFNFEFKSIVNDEVVCDTGNKVAVVTGNGISRHYELMYEEEDCDIKIMFDITGKHDDFEYSRLSYMYYRGSCQKYCNESLVIRGFTADKDNLYPSVKNGMSNLDAVEKMQTISNKKEKERWN